MAPERGPRVFLGLALLVGLAAAMMLRPLLGSVVLAVTLGHLLFPLYAWLEARLPRQWPAATIVLLLVAFLLVGPFVLIAFLFIGDVQRLIADIDSRADVEDRIEGALADLGLPGSFVEGLGERAVTAAAEWLRDEAVPIASLATEFLIGLVVFFILIFYVLTDGRALVERLHLLPAPREDIDRALAQVSQRVKAIVVGTVGVAVIQAAIATAGWWLLGLPAPWFWGAVILVLELVPLVGSFVVLLPAAIWAFLNGDIWTGVGLLVLNFVMVGLIDDVLRPYLIGRRSGVHPTLVLIGIVGGLPLFGISGIILGPLLMGLLAPLYIAWAKPHSGAPRDEDGTGEPVSAT